MINIDCPHCHKSRLLSTRDVISMHRSLEGTVAYVRCPCGGIAIQVIPRASKPKTRIVLPSSDRAENPSEPTPIEPERHAA